MRWDRQQRILEDGGRITQETRGWVEERGVTVSQRSKEQAHDYRYFPDPDLPPLQIDREWVEEIRSRLPELAVQRQSRFVEHYGLPSYDAALLTGARAMADYFEEAVAARTGSGLNLEQFAKNVSNWMLGDLSRLINLENLAIDDVRVSPAQLAELLGFVDSGTLSTTMAKTVLEEAFETGDNPGSIVENRGYSQIRDSSVVESAVSQALADNPRAVADYLGGKETASRFLVGQVMKLTRGQAKPDLVLELVVTALEELKETG